MLISLGETTHSAFVACVFVTWAWGYKTFSFSTQLSMNFIMLINEHDKYMTTSESLKARKILIVHHFSFYEHAQLKFYAQLTWARKKFL